MNITEEQKQQLMATTMECGRNAWAYTLTWPTDDQPWIAAGILSCMKKGYSLNRLTVNWEARELRYTNSADCGQSSENQIPILTEKQQLQLQQTILENGMNAWDYVLAEREEDRPWAIAGILSCMKKGYNLNSLMICWEARELRYANAADCAQSSENQISILTEEQQQLLQQTALTDGTNGWDWVQQQRKEDQPWAAAGVLSCIDKGYDLNEAMICWEARELRYKE